MLDIAGIFAGFIRKYSRRKNDFARRAQCGRDVCAPSSVPATHCLTPALEELLSFVQPALLNPVLISGRSLDCFNTGLHRTGGFLAVAKPGMRPSDQVQGLGVIWTVIQKLLQH